MATQTLHKFVTQDGSFRFKVNKVKGALEVEMIDCESQEEFIVANDLATLDEFITIFQRIRPFMAAAESSAPPRVAAESSSEEDDESDPELEDEEDDEFDDEDESGEVDDEEDGDEDD